MIRRTPATSLIDRTAISSYDRYCDGYMAAGNQGQGYVSVLKVSVGQVKKTQDFLLDSIVAYDRAECNDAYVGQINMLTASSFCGIAGQVWGFDLAIHDEILKGNDKLLFEVDQYDGTKLPVYDAQYLLKAGEALFGTDKARRYPPVPGGHVICANKSVTTYRPVSGPLADGQAYGCWCFIAISMTRNREGSADLFIEDAGLWTKNDNPDDLRAFLDQHAREVVWSVTSCGADSEVLFDRTYIGYNYLIMDPGYIGTALTCAPYVALAKKAVPPEGFHHLNDITLSQWEAAQPSSCCGKSACCHSKK